jgi:hypothetical protein
MTDPLRDSDRELVVWGPLGRAARGGSWARQAEPTIDRIEQALADGRGDDAAALVRHLVVEATEIHELYSEWCAAIPRILAREGVAPERVAALAAEAESRAGQADHEAGWQRFVAAADACATGILRDPDTAPAVGAVVDAWLTGHDAHLLATASWIGAAVSELGEARLGELWSELQREPIASYDRYDTAVAPWDTSFALLVQIAIEGMHAHYGGPERRGEIELIEHPDRVELRFAPCGSGGRVRGDERFGVTQERHPFAWNRTGVCHYCIHCCVLQQLAPIRRLGYPGRVIEPPTEPGMPCSWSVYRDPRLVPDSAYEAVGEPPPRRDER